MAYTKGMIFDIIKANGNERKKLFTYKEVGVHYATLNALVKRGYLSKEESGYRVTRKGEMFAIIEEAATGREFITLRNETAQLGMLCSIKGADILDCWGDPWNWGHEGVFICPNRKPEIFLNNRKEGN